MQTFLPYADFVASAKCLDRQRLCKQRSENNQIYKALIGETSGYASHPATLMWVGYLPALHWYAIAILDEWAARGYNDFTGGHWYVNRPKVWTPPPWLGDSRLHSSHRSKLLEKDPEWYKHFNWYEKPGMEYFWPTHMEEYR